MNADTLEALLIDRALGQLSPEVEALLAEHLAVHPEAARAGAELSKTVTLATSLLKQPARTLALPPATISLFPRHRFRRVLALAASFVAGACVSFFAVGGIAPPREKPLAFAPVVAPAPPVRRVETELAVRALPFWSKERAVALATSKQSIRQP